MWNVLNLRDNVWSLVGPGTSRRLLKYKEMVSYLEESGLTQALLFSLAAPNQNFSACQS